MKGHLGFPCRPCLMPGPPTNLRQVGIGNAGSSLSGTLAWDAPESVGGGPITGYRVEIAVNSLNTSWQVVSNNEAWLRQANLSWCDGGVFRVFAINRCGAGQPAGFSNWTFAGGSNVSLITASTTLSPPCWSTSVKVWCVGGGGTWSGGGGGGGLAYKTWSRSPFSSWGEGLACVVRPTANQSGPALASVTYDGQTVVGYYGSANEVGTYSGGDGGATGNPGGADSITYPFTGPTQYSGPCNFGGGIGGPIGTNQDGSSIYPSGVSPCRRRPGTSRSGLFDAVSMLGMRVTEECDATPAFGSGGVTFTMPVYGGSQRVDFTAGYGGGGFDSTNPGGPGCIVVRYT